MGFLRRTSAAADQAPVPAVRGTVAAEFDVLPLETPGTTVARFGVDPDTGVLYGVPTLDDYIFRTGRITRDEAMRVPAVKRARDLICGSIGQFPLRVYGPDGRVSTTFSPSIFGQPEVGIAPSVTWTNVLEDMLLYGAAWLHVTAYGWHGRPAQVVRLDPATITVQKKLVQFPEGSAWVWPDIPGVIRIDSPNEGLLDVGTAIKACVAIERHTLNAVDGTPPVDYFTTDADVDPFEGDDDAAAFLDSWVAARRQRATGFVPAGLKYNVAGWDPDKLQLSEVRKDAILEVARLTGIDAEELSVAVTSRTYFNGQDRRRIRVEDVFGPYMTAAEGRLSMGDVSPLGHYASFDTSAYLRLDDLAAAQTDGALINAKVLTPDEARAKRGLEPLGNTSETPKEITA